MMCFEKKHKKYKSLIFIVDEKGLGKQKIAHFHKKIQFRIYFNSSFFLSFVNLRKHFCQKYKYSHYTISFEIRWQKILSCYVLMASL